MLKKAILVVTLLVSASHIYGQQPGANADFRKDVQPIFHTNCTLCHQGSGAPAGLQLDTAEGVMRGSASEKVIVPGNSKDSVLVQRVTDKSMPPTGPLTDNEIAVITAWVDQGAKTD